MSAYEQAEMKYRNAGDRLSAAEVHIRIGEVYDEIGDLERAEISYRAVLAAADEIGDRNLRLRAGVMLAAVAIDQEKQDVAKEWLDDAFSELRGLLREFAGQPFKPTHALTGDTVIATQMLGGACAWWPDCRELAVPLLKFSLAAHRTAPNEHEIRDEISDDLYYLGMAFAQTGQLKEAWRRFEQTQAADRRLGRREDYWLLNQMGGALEKQGRLDAAFQYHTRATELLEKTTRRQRIAREKFSSREATFSFYQDVVQDLVEMHAQTRDENHLREAFRYLERGKAQTLLDLLAYGQEPDWNENASTDGRVRNPIRATLKEVEASVDEGTLLLEYALGEKRSVLWAVSRSGTRTVSTLADEETVARLVSSYVQLLRKPLAGVERESYRRLGGEIYRVLLEPVHAELARAKHLIIVPDGILHYLPFEALPITRAASPDAPNQETSSEIYLGTKCATSYAPSSSVLLALDRRRSDAPRAGGASEPQIAIFGNPILAPTREEPRAIKSECSRRVATLPELPRSAEEVGRIAAVYGIPPDSPSINLGEMASINRFREMDLARYRILHFATHAITGDRVTGFSQPALILAPDKNGERCLRMSEIFNLHLDADLIVLSACETAVGHFYRGEGMVGLTSAFLYAGSRSVVASLWPVYDQSTSLFMEAFYRHLKEGQSKAEALRLARVETMSRRVWSDALGEEQSLALPYFWAPFVLIGNGS